MVSIHSGGQFEHFGSGGKGEEVSSAHGEEVRRRDSLGSGKGGEKEEL